ncbi:hypothetical protein BKA83DRAFT_686021 [Pisolithus microcarpus]|nr:hypothetical protein BKA83DRAFT_686021 [Pisolithus microcarpus]
MFSFPSTELVSSHAGIPPSISSLFGTNQVPSLVDQQYVYDILLGCKSELGGVTDELCRAHAEVERLEGRLGQIKGVISELEALLHPIRRVPTDIMAKVFEHCVYESQGYARLDIKHAPLSLSQVCRSWRKLVFALPCLWKMVRVDFSTSSPNWYRLMHSKATAMRLWISRSRSVPVSLFLTSYNRVIPSPFLALLDMEIMEAGPRIRELSLRFPTSSLCRLLSFTQGPLEFLEYLHLQSTDTLPGSHSIPPLVLKSASSLQSLNISCFDLDMRGHQVPWAQLTELSLRDGFSPIGDQAPSDYLPILIQCPNLRTCSLGFGSSIPDMISDSVTPVVLPHLCTLKMLTYAETPYLKLFFGALLLPKLRSFSINYANSSIASHFHETECLQMLNRAAETVESVSLCRMDVPDVELSSCLSQLPHLKSLRFRPGRLGLNHDLVAMLTVPSSVTRHGGRTLHQRTICPSLESLDLRCSAAVPVDAVVALVDSRRQFEPRLKHFSLQLAEFAYEHDRGDEIIHTLEARLSGHVDKGLQLILTM